MPRARIPDASLVAGADALILPWLAPRALAESPVVRRRRRHGGSRPAQTARAQMGHAGARAAAGHGSSRSHWQPRTRPALDLRYADIASFAHRHARRYTTGTETFTTTSTTRTAASSATPTTGTESSAQATTRPAPPTTTAASKASSGSRYSRRRPWKDELSRHAADLTPEKAGRARLKHMAVAEARLKRQVERLQRDRWRFRNKLLYDGQYRSLRRSILGLKRWGETTEDVRKDSSIDPDDEHWILRTFAALDRSTYARTNVLTKPVTLQHDPRCRRYTSRLFAGVDENGPERLWTNWHDFGESKKFYESILVYMLDQQPGRAQAFLPVLAADASLPEAKSVILADALAHLAKLHVKGEYPSDQGWGLTSNANARNFISTFLLCTRFVNTAVYSQDLLHSLVLLADTADLQKTYDMLIESKTRLSVGTTLHYASAFGEAGEFRYALQCLERRLAAFKETERALVVDTERFRWTCAAILRGSMRRGNNYHETPSIVAAFVGLGVKMDLLLYDVVMRNAMDAGDFATAFKVYNALDQNGLTPDKYTFSILLHGCTKQSDPAMFKDFGDWCVEKAKELGDPWLATDCLYYAYICEQSKATSARDMGLLWRTYFHLFDLTPLEPFSRYGSRPMKDAIDQHLEPNTQKLASTPMAVYLMLQTEIQTTQALGIHYLERLYKTLKQALLKAPHPALASLAQTPAIWNAFLHAFCAQKQYASASQVIKDMTAHGPAPNIYSWNMFMQSFFKTGQVTAAERVFAIMRARGVDPDAYTYGVMVRGYAKAQLVDRIGETMQHIAEEAQLDPDLLRALAQVQKRQDLTVALEKSRVEREAKEAQAKEQAAREEQERFETPRFASLLTNALRFRPAAHWDNGVANDDFMEPDDEEVVVESKKLEGRTDVDSLSSSDPRFKSLLGSRTSGVAAKPLPQFNAPPTTEARFGGVQSSEEEK
ncbi:hypothetical protein ST47_g593 [Ascochyta rabiei]|uniref:Uncharacterized protein n=2 Tax=Didymella rabiei TaxID=5454 RepID=A0A163LZF3_DIDRA|nr:hypothetical protein ST47_g593 [Ascochyta rabiei]